MIQTPLMNIMTAAVKKAATPIIRDFNEVENLQNSPKGTEQFTQYAENRTVQIIQKELEKTRPGYDAIIKNQKPINGPDKSHRWFINPINGSENFSRAIQHFAIVLTLQREYEIVATIIYNPITNEMFQAEKNQGAWFNAKRIKVSKKNNIQNALIAINNVKPNDQFYKKFTHEITNLMQKSKIVRNMGALTLDSAFLAAGKIDIIWYRNEKIWNIAATKIIIKEAGGNIEDIDETEQNPIKTGNILASNNAIPDIRKYAQ